MGSWAAWDVAQVQMAELRRAGQRGRRGQAGNRDDAGLGVATLSGASTIKRARRHGIAVWVGYRMIGVGCRLARSAVVTSARAGM